MSVSPPPNNTGDLERDENPAAQEINWEDFRDHLATADQEGHRRWIYPKKVRGPWFQRRTYVSWLLLAIMFAGPFIRVNGNPLLLLNIVERKFSIFGHIFWPQDMVIFAVAMLVFLTSIIIFSTAFGRLWCGWACPQTVLMEMVFRKIEFAIEGDAPQQRALDASPWTSKKTVKKLAKHSIFFGLSFVIGNTLLSYIIGSGQLIQISTDDPRKHVVGLGFMMLFAFIFYAIFARFREQACTFICPYGRFQSTIIDENTLVVAYDHKRGEQRAPWQRQQTDDQRRGSGFGDCINCRQCVAVCPTGIDIRNGTQMECINCTACIDACDTIMDKISRPHGLIRFASLNHIEQGGRQRLTPRMIGYSTLLLGLIGLFFFLLLTRSDVEATLLRAPGALFSQTSSGTIQNIYTLKLANKTSREIPVVLKLENVAGKLTLMGGANLLVPKENLAQTSVLIELAPTALSGRNTQLRIGIYSNERRLGIVNTVFAAPREYSP